MDNTMEKAVEETVVKAPSKALVAGGVAGVTLLVGGLVYKFVIKPIVNKKKSQEALETEEDNCDYREVEVEK